jgi:hypothetical protein
MPYILRTLATMTMSTLICLYRWDHEGRLFLIEKGLSVSHVNSEGSNSVDVSLALAFVPRRIWKPHLSRAGDCLLNFLSEGLLQHSFIRHTLHPVASPPTPTATLLPCWPWYTCHNDANIIIDTPCVSFLLAIALNNHVTDDCPPCRTNTITTTTLSSFPSSS